MYTVTPPGHSEMTVPSLLLTTTGRKSGEKFVFPLFYGETGNSYIIVASKGGAPQHPGWYKNLLANPAVEVQVGTKEVQGEGPDHVRRGARPAVEKGPEILATVCGLREEDRARNSRRRARPRQLVTFVIASRRLAAWRSRTVRAAWMATSPRSSP